MKSSRLTKKEKHSGKRKLLISSIEAQEKMGPIELDDFTGLLRKAIPPRRFLFRNIELVPHCSNHGNRALARRALVAAF
jgi:hypothetical protein